MARNDRHLDSASGRREFLRLVGAGGAAGGLAGCVGTSDEGDDDPTPTEGDESTEENDGPEETEPGDDGEPIDDAFTTKVQLPPNDIQYNPYNPQNHASDAESVMFDLLANFDPVSGEWIPVIVSDWSLEGDSLALSISDEHYWHDGDPVTARDLATKWRLDMHMGKLVSEFADEIRVVDEKTLELDLKSETVNPDVLSLRLFNERLLVKHDEFERHLEAFEAADSDEETEAAQTELVERKIEEPIGNGPFEHESAQSQWVRTTRFEEYSTADAINFPTYEFKFLDSNQKRWAALMNDDTDGESHMGLPQDILDQMPDHVDLIRPPEKDGTSLVFQQHDTVFGDARVRKAIAYAIDGELIGENSTINYQFEADTFNTGLMPTHVQNRLDDDVVSNFTDYAISGEEAERKATELLEDAGFEKDGDTWLKPDGSTFRLPVTTIGAWWASQSQTIVGQLQAFGIEAEAVNKDIGSFFADMGNGNFEVAVSFYGGRFHPHESMTQLFDTDNDTYAGDEYEVPMPVGDPDGDLETVDVAELTEQLLHAREEAEVDELVTKLAWVYNQTLPRPPHLVGTGMTFLTNDHWEYPDPDSDVMNIFFPTFWLLREGKFAAKTE